MVYEIRKKTGRLTDGYERGKGVLFHAVVCETALCGAKPGRLSAGWSIEQGDKVTCDKCLKKLSKLMNKNANKITSK